MQIKMTVEILLASMTLGNNHIQGMEIVLQMHVRKDIVTYHRITI